MSGLRSFGQDAGGLPRTAFPGDILMAGENIVAGVISSTATSLVAPASAIVSGIAVRSDTSAGIGISTDTWDSAQNIISALAGGSGNGANVTPGTTFRVRYVNKLSGNLTLAFGSGVTLGAYGLSGAIVIPGNNSINLTGALVGNNNPYAELLATVVNSAPAQTINMSFTTANGNLSFVFPTTAQTVLSQNSRDPQLGVGMVISGTALTAVGITVIGLIEGVGGLTGVVSSSAPSAVSAAGGNSITFTPSIRVDRIG